MKLIGLLTLLALIACEKDTSPKTKIVMISMHEASDSYYMHLQAGSVASYKKVTRGDFEVLSRDFSSYILNDAHENFTEEDFRAEISNPNHTLYKCLTPDQLTRTDRIGQTGQLSIAEFNLECWQGEWFN